MIDTGLAVSFDDPGKADEIDPKWLEFMDVSKKMLDNGYVSKMDEYYWSKGWLDAMNGKGDKPVFGCIISYDHIDYLLSSEYLLNSTDGDWAICLPPFNTRAGLYTGIMVNKDSPNKDALGLLIEWLTLDCSESGLQYILANDVPVDEDSPIHGLTGGKRAVAIGNLLKNTECSIDLLGGQNINPVIYEALHTQTGINDVQGMEAEFFGHWVYETRAYLYGEKDRETAVADYKAAQNEKIGWFRKFFEDYGISFLLPD